MSLILCVLANNIPKISNNRIGINEFIYIYIRKNKFKNSIGLLNSYEYT